MSLHFLDSGIIILYLLSIIVLGFWRREKDTENDFLLMGRRLSLPAFVGTMVSTWYGGILGVSEFSYSYGISNWIVFGVPYYIFALIFALWVARSARQSRVTTLPELLNSNYGPGVGFMGAVWVLVLGSPAPYVLTIGFLISFFFPLSFPLALLLGTLFSTLYILRGGLRSVVRTDLLQFILMFSGFLIVFLVLTTRVGTPVEIWSQLPQDHRSYDGGQGADYILVWFLIASMTLIDPGFHQRIYATRDVKTARRGLFWSVGFWFLFDLLTTFTGLYAYTLLPDTTNPPLAFIDLGASILPAGVFGIFIVGLLATVMSTLDSNTLVSGMTLGHDILKRWHPLKDRSGTALTRIGIVISLAIGALMAWLIPSVVDLWYTFGTIAVPAMLLPVLWAYRTSAHKPAGIMLLNLILAPAVSLTWLVAARGQDGVYLWGIEPFYPGICLSILLMLYALRQKSTKGSL